MDGKPGPVVPAEHYLVGWETLRWVLLVSFHFHGDIFGDTEVEVFLVDINLGVR